MCLSLVHPHRRSSPTATLICTCHPLSNCAGAVELRNLLSQHFQLDLPATFTFDHPSLAAMAAYLASRLSAASPAAAAAGSSVFVEDREVDDTSGPERQLAEPAIQPHLLQATEVVAVSGRYPQPLLAAQLDGSYGSGGADSLWAGLCHSADLQSVLPLSRWDMDAWFAPDQGTASPHSRGTMYTRFGACCLDVHAFDAAAFRLSATEAQAVDPQVRWACLNVHALLSRRDRLELHFGAY